MVKHLGILVITGLLAPSFVAAQAGAAPNAEIGVQTSSGAGPTNRANVNTRATSTARINAGDTKPATTTGNATSSARRADGKPATTGNATSAAAKARATGNATSSANNPAWGQKGGLVGFLKSLFGMSDSSTSDLRTAMNASTTATSSSSQGVGFFARIMGLFGFGK